MANPNKDAFKSGVYGQRGQTRQRPVQADLSSINADITTINTSLSNKVAKGDLVKDVTDYGATGDGTTDDTSAIQDAIDDGYRIFFPPGTYKVSSALTLASGTRLEGASTRQTTISSTHAGAVISVPTSGTRSFGQQITQLTFSGPGSTTASSVAIDWDSVSQAHVSDVVVTGYETGIKVHSTTNGGSVYNRFTNVTASTCDTGISIESSGSNATTFDRCRANACTTYGVSVVDSNDCTLIGCQIESCGTGFRIHATAASLANYNSAIGCRFESNTTAWSTTANVADTMIVSPHAFGTYTISDSGTRTLHYGQTTGETQKWQSQLQSTTGSFSFTRLANGGTETPALLVTDSVTSAGTPVTVQAATERAVGYMFRGTRGGNTYFDVNSTDGSIRLPQKGYVELVERTADPAAPSANTLRLYAKDDGAGKTGLYVRFPTGAAVQIAVEP